MNDAELDNVEHDVVISASKKEAGAGAGSGAGDRQDELVFGFATKCRTMSSEDDADEGADEDGALFQNLQEVVVYQK